MHILITPKQAVYMYKYITILGAAGQIAQRLTATLLTYTDMHITLYGRQLSTRIHPEILEHERVTVIEGSFQNPKKLEESVKISKSLSDNLPISYVQGERQARNVLRESNLNYTILRLPWLYNNMENTNYELIAEGTPFNDAQVTREAVVKAQLEILTSLVEGQNDIIQGRTTTMEEAFNSIDKMIHQLD